MDLLNIKELDRWIVGDSWINSEIHDHLNKLCDEIGPRWATSKEERYAGNYLHEKFQEYGLDVERDNFEIESWIPRNFTLKINESSLDIKPFNRCPSINIKSKIIDVGFGTEKPYLILGAPWLGTSFLAQKLKDQGLKGVEFKEINYRPTGSIYYKRVPQYDGLSCSGIEIIINDKDEYEIWYIIDMESNALAYSRQPIPFPRFIQIISLN